MFNILITFIVVLTLSRPTSAQELFPDKCIGNWEGTMYIYGTGVLRDSVPVRMTIARINDTAWTWKTNYLSPTRPMVKDYVFRLVDRAKHQYVTDEGDGILLAESVFGAKAYSVFETQGILLTATYERRDDLLIFEVTSGKKNQAAGEVLSHPVTSLQSAILRKTKNPRP